VINVAAEKEEFGRTWDESDGGKRVSSFGDDDLGSTTIDDAYKLLERHALRNRMMLGERYTTHIDTRAAVAIFRGLSRSQHSKDHIVDLFAKALDQLNAPLYAIYDDDVKTLKSNLAGRLRYMRVEEGGPKMGLITKESPFCEDYFTRLDLKDPRTKKHDPKELSLANNGWIWAADPLMDFASNKARVYLRREVIAWGDCVKLRYGSGPQDSPFLWKHMEEYCISQAKIFDGFRIDNCHSTPVHVGQYMLDASRKANPNLYICAELFTGSEQTDLVFVSKLGINSLIREMENGHDPKEQSRLLYRFGVNKPIGSMDADCLSKASQIQLPGKSSSQPCLIVPLEGSSPHALFMDLTHDNETPTRKRTTEDAITMASLVSFSWSAVGSNKGFDDLYPDQLNVVSETRKYDPKGHSDDQGIRLIRRIFSHLHQEMVTDGYSEGHAHQENDYLMMHRVHPRTHKGYLLVTRTAFQPGGSKESGSIKPFRLNRTDVKFIIGKSLKITSRDAPKDDTYVQGIPSQLVDIGAPQVRQGKDDDGPFSEIVVPANFPPASIMLFATSMQGLGADLDAFCQQGASDAVKDLDLVDLNVVLYRADAEERDATSGQDGAYTIPDLGPLVYCGTEGFMAHLKHIMRFNDLGHPLCAHLRNGSWALDFVYKRLERQEKLFPRLSGLVNWYRQRMEKIKEVVPSFMRPKYFSLVIKTVSDAAKARAIAQMSEFVRQGDDFTKSLALCAVQLNGQVQSASLWHDRPSASMAAGLPFFTTSWARLWGRDVFISLRGLYLTTAMHNAAREHILSFGSTLKHGMIPNLLNSTASPRYNCRDGPWFFAQNVQDYVNKVPNGESILSEKIKRRFPIDDEWVPVDSPKAFAHVSTVAEIIQEILQRHATGIHFREHGAGPDIDNDMTDKGFNIDVTVDWHTGFVMGGNPHNCGTWQDKMGSSAKAGNKGVPGSPREGAAVEITALLKSTLRWVDSLAGKGKWPAKGVKANDGQGDRTISYGEWADKIQQSFERCYYVPLDAEEDGKYDVDPQLVNRRGIYKDVYGSHAGREWCDYQLRANYAIAMCVAPELFNPQHGLIALQSAYVALGDVLGMKTLDPQDCNYHPVYDNSNDTDDFWMAKGFCYHNGPPWVFPFGFHLRALLLMSERADKLTDTKSAKGQSWCDQSAWRVMSLLIPHRRHVDTSPWAGLPELTNAEGAECRDSCPTQAWSASTILDALELIGEQQGTLAGH
jgi:glycogen debranching enzyme